MFSWEFLVNVPHTLLEIEESIRIFPVKSEAEKLTKEIAKM